MCSEGYRALIKMCNTTDNFRIILRCIDWLLSPYFILKCCRFNFRCVRQANFYHCSSKFWSRRGSPGVFCRWTVIKCILQTHFIQIDPQLLCSFLPPSSSSLCPQGTAGVVALLQTGLHSNDMWLHQPPTLLNHRHTHRHTHMLRDKWQWS